MKQWSYAVFCMLFILILSSCSSLHEGNTKRAACNLLKSKMIFSGSTSDARKAEIENAEEPLDQRTYDSNCE